MSCSTSSRPQYQAQTGNLQPRSNLRNSHLPTYRPLHNLQSAPSRRTLSVRSTEEDGTSTRRAELVATPSHQVHVGSASCTHRCAGTLSRYTLGGRWAPVSRWCTAPEHYPCGEKSDLTSSSPTDAKVCYALCVLATLREVSKEVGREAPDLWHPLTPPSAAVVDSLGACDLS